MVNVRKQKPILEYLQMKKEFTDVVGDYAKQIYHLNANTLP